MLLVGGGIANSAGRDANHLSPAAAAADPEFRVGTLKLIPGSKKSPGQRQRLLIVRSKTKTTRTNLTKLGLRPPPPSPQRELVLFSFPNRLECNCNMILQFWDRSFRMHRFFCPRLGECLDASRRLVGGLCLSCDPIGPNYKTMGQITNCRTPNHSHL